MKALEMGADYYYLLAINADATQDEIHKAYRRLALKYHPQRNRGKPDTYEKFFWISEAYEVLIDPQLRARYDQYGEEGLKHGAPFQTCTPEKYAYHGDPYRTFQNYFGGTNPFREFPQEMELEQMENFGRKDGRGQPKKGDPTICDLLLTLEEIYNGSFDRGRTASFPLPHQVLNKDSDTTELQEKILTIEVLPGWLEGTKVIFANEGNQGPNTIPGDVIFIVKAKKHDTFVRDGHNLIHTAEIPVAQALLGVTLVIKTLDDRILRVAITQVVKEGYVKIVEGEGMPISKTPEKKGDLHIKFKYIFPDRLTQEQKLGVEAALYRNGEILSFT
ncbi:unnamed protein product [Schistocephalus solidus]|uniref:DnaJ homolog subfamily B member 13 n=1 Tax=Schistocephalus solidus TaxID=70667 RepID=A0A183SY05_SCHSO|nr:unnamed protein product [Schistocephalus solidus]